MVIKNLSGLILVLVLIIGSLTGGLLFSQDGANLHGLLKEKVSISADKLSVNTQIDVGASAVHYRTTAETTTSTPNIRYSAGMSLNDAMNVGEALTVTIITTAAAAGYSADITIDGNNLSENWIGGSAPSHGGDQVLIFTPTILLKLQTQHLQLLLMYQMLLDGGN